MSGHRYGVGDKVVYTRDKYTSRPGPRAKNLSPARNGESYQYQVEKYWRVTEVHSNNTVVLCTRRGKTHVTTFDDPRLRPATWMERLWKSALFPALPSSSTAHALPE